MGFAHFYHSDDKVSRSVKRETKFSILDVDYLLHKK